MKDEKRRQQQQQQPQHGDEMRWWIRKWDAIHFAHFRRVWESEMPVKIREKNHIKIDAETQHLNSNWLVAIAGCRCRCCCCFFGFVCKNSCRFSIPTCALCVATLAREKLRSPNQKIKQKEHHPRQQQQRRRRRRSRSSNLQLLYFTHDGQWRLDFGISNFFFTPFHYTHRFGSTYLCSKMNKKNRSAYFPFSPFIWPLPKSVIKKKKTKTKSYVTYRTKIQCVHVQVFCSLIHHPTNDNNTIDERKIHATNTKLSQNDLIVTCTIRKEKKNEAERVRYLCDLSSTPAQICIVVTSHTECPFRWLITILGLLWHNVQYWKSNSKRNGKKNEFPWRK